MATFLLHADLSL